jgi:hypothetical protein
LLQLTAFLEVLHSALGLVRSVTLYNFLQWLGRSHVLFAIIAQIPEVQEQPPILITFSAWALSEVIRCPYYVLTLMGMCPRWLIWLRYTAFVVLYPVGALYGESKLCLTKHGPQVHQVPHIKQKKNITPNTYSYWTYYVGQAVRLLARWMYVTACDVCERGT